MYLFLNYLPITSEGDYISHRWRERFDRYQNHGVNEYCQQFPFCARRENRRCQCAGFWSVSVISIMSTESIIDFPCTILTARSDVPIIYHTGKRKQRLWCQRIGSIAGSVRIDSSIGRAKFEASSISSTLSFMSTVGQCRWPYVQQNLHIHCTMSK